MKTSAQKRAIKKYRDKLEQINLSLPKGSKDIIKDAAADAGLSVNSFIITAINYYIEHMDD
jgi:uncharacterized protein (DUF1778 family)